MRDFSNDTTALALNTATLGHNLDGFGAGWDVSRIADACAERGFGGVVFWRREIGQDAVRIGNRVRAAGLSVVGLCRAPYLTGPLALSSRDAILDDFRVAIDQAAGLGAPVLTIVTGGVEPGTKGIGDSLKRIRDLTGAVAGFAAERDVSLALEPLHPVYAGDRSALVTMREAVDIALEIDAPNVGVAVDVYHVWWDTTLAENLVRLGGERIFGFHLCDWLAETRDVLLDRGMMGDGVADLKALRAAVEGAGYTGFCEVEIFSASNWWKRDQGEVLDVVVDRFRTVC